jgi:hypothetical protein
MMKTLVLAALTAQTIVFILGGVVVVMVFILTLTAVGKDENDKKFILAVIGLLLGLFGGGGIGALVGSQSANSSAQSVKSEVKTVATQAANSAASSVTSAVNNAVRAVQSQRSRTTKAK